MEHKVNIERLRINSDITDVIGNYFDIEKARTFFKLLFDDLLMSMETRPTGYHDFSLHVSSDILRSVNGINLTVEREQGVSTLYSINNTLVKAFNTSLDPDNVFSKFSQNRLILQSVIEGLSRYFHVNTEASVGDDIVSSAKDALLRLFELPTLDQVTVSSIVRFEQGDAMYARYSWGTENNAITLVVLDDDSRDVETFDNAFKQLFSRVRYPFFQLI